jgi:hypothetical protein
MNGTMAKVYPQHTQVITLDIQVLLIVIKMISIPF